MNADPDMKLVLGTMNFGPQVDEAGSLAMVDAFLEAGHSEIDTAYVYNNGITEEMLGVVLPRSRLPFLLATKVNPRITGKLDASAVRIQLETSLRRLKRDTVDLLYLHFPDPNTPLDQTLEACACLHAEGKFQNLGLSNFAAWEVVDICHLCDREGWPRPVVYQGLYNALSRGVEPELLPALRRLGMRFYAYNPFAGGILAGKYKDYEEVPEPGRFTVRPNYRDRYWKRSFFDALAILTEACSAASIPLVEAAYRWLAFHSGLSAAKGDSVIIGASKVEQIDQNLRAFSNGPLPGPILGAFSRAWVEARADCPDYFRSSI